MSGCGGCDVCGGKGCQKCCNQPCLEWGFDDCFLRGRCPDGTELTPLDLCAWLKVHETCTDFRLVPNTETGAYMQFTNECGEVEKIYVCDFLSLGDLECIGNVWSDPAKPCDIMMFQPGCDMDPCDPRYGKWSHYHIPRVEETRCELQPDDEGYIHILSLDDCGCLQECKVFVVQRCWEYSLRDSWPDDPDWPFTIGSRQGDNTEIIDLELKKRIPMFGKTDLKVTFQYGYGVQNTNPASVTRADYNFKSVVYPVSTAKHVPSAVDMYERAITVQLTNELPWGSHEVQVARTVIVPKGQELFLIHEIVQRDIHTNIIPFGGTSDNPPADSSRLHQLHIFVEPTQGVKL